MGSLVTRRYALQLLTLPLVGCAAEGVRYFRKTGLYPINHGMVMKRELADKYPWVLTNILKAFKRAAAFSDRRRVEHAEYYFETGVLPAEEQQAFDAPLITQGVAANRTVIATIERYSRAQGRTPKLMQIVDLLPVSMKTQ